MDWERYNFLLTQSMVNEYYKRLVMWKYEDCYSIIVVSKAESDYPGIMRLLS